MLNNVNLMERTEGVYLGRVMAVTMMAFGVNSIASYPIGLLADRVGERATLMGLACACLAVVCVGVVAMRANSGHITRPVTPETPIPSRPRA
jgi:MFS family permease